ncbi:hypothetical protein QUB63_19035 [Microcoleus sp. ARI1-B5]
MAFKTVGGAALYIWIHFLSLILPRSLPTIARALDLLATKL